MLVSMKFPQFEYSWQMAKRYLAWQTYSNFGVTYGLFQIWSNALKYPTQMFHHSNITLLYCPCIMCWLSRIDIPFSVWCLLWEPFRTVHSWSCSVMQQSMGSRCRTMHINVQLGGPLAKNVNSRRELIRILLIL